MLGSEMDFKWIYENDLENTVGSLQNPSAIGHY